MPEKNPQENLEDKTWELGKSWLHLHNQDRMPCWSHLRPWGSGKVSWTVVSLAVLILRTHVKIHFLKIHWDVGLFPTTETYEEGPAWSASISTFFQIIHSQLAIAPVRVSGVRWGLWGTSLDWHPNKCVSFLPYQTSTENSWIHLSHRRISLCWDVKFLFLVRCPGLAHCCTQHVTDNVPGSS